MAANQSKRLNWPQMAKWSPSEAARNELESKLPSCLVASLFEVRSPKLEVRIPAQKLANKRLAGRNWGDLFVLLSRAKFHAERAN